MGVGVMPFLAGLSGQQLPMQELEACQKAASTCSADPGAPLVAYVSKMVAVPASALPRVPGKENLSEGIDCSETPAPAMP